MVDSETDPHGQTVIGELLNLDVRAVRYNLEDLRRHLIAIRPGVIDLVTPEHCYQVTSATTVWWRRQGWIDVSDLDDEEAQLALDEGPHILQGCLHAAGVRWVDDPGVVDQAELKLFQLRVASRLGIRVPASLATNDPRLARDFAVDRSCVVKPLSPGLGIAPYTERVTDDDFDLLSRFPALIQEEVSATADLRVVIIGRDAWIWRRPRSHSTLDWRAEDRSGSGFTKANGHEEDRELLDCARQLTSALGLSMAVQDWLETEDGPVFLESNAQGNWLFLEGAKETVAPRLAQYLAQRPEEDKGVWPSPWKRFKDDFRPKEDLRWWKSPPAKDGTEAPEVFEPAWLYEVATRPGALEVARRANDQASESAKAAETKANRQVQISLSVLTLAFVVGRIQLGLVVNKHWLWMLTLIVVLYAIASLAISAFQALQVDRVGSYHVPSGQSLAALGAKDPVPTILAKEERGRRWATWTSEHKHSDLMQARAWFTRGLATLILAAVVMLVSWWLVNNELAAQWLAQIGV